MLKRKYKIARRGVSTALILAFLFAAGTAYGAMWAGTVVDANTGAPIRGAVVLRSWRSLRPSVAGEMHTFHSAEEGVSDAEGRVKVAGRPLNISRLFRIEKLEENPIIVFAPGYQPSEFDRSHSVIRITGIPTAPSDRHAALKRLLSLLGEHLRFRMPDAFHLKEAIAREQELIACMKRLGRMSVARKAAPLPVAGTWGEAETGNSRAPAATDRKKTASVPPIAAAAPEGILDSRSAQIRATWALADRRPPAVCALINALGHPNPAVRLTAKSAIVRCGATAIEPLRRRLESGESGQRRVAAELLSAIEKPEAKEALLSAFGNESDPRVLASIADALSKSPTPGAQRAFLWASRNESPAVRSIAARGLGKIGGEKAVDRLLSLLRDRRWTVRSQAAKALCPHAEQRVSEALVLLLKDPRREVRGSTCRCLAKRKPFPEQLLVDTIDNANVDTRSAATRLLGMHGSANAVAPLTCLLLSDQSFAVRSAAITALGRIGDPKAVDSIQKALLKDNRLHLAAVRALGSIRSPDAAQPLYKMLVESKKRPQDSADALAGQGNCAIAYLAAASKSKDPAVAVAATLALGKTRRPEAVPPLLKAWDAKDPGRRQAAARALALVGPAATFPVAQNLKVRDAYDRWRAAWVLAMIDSPATIGPLMASLSDPAGEVRWIAASALGQKQTAEAVTGLRTLLQDKDPGIRAAASKALQQIPRK